MAKPGRLVIDHEDGMAVLATWWKAFFLTPVWAFLLIMPLGSMIRYYWPTYEMPGYFLMIGLGLIYFARDMAKRRIIIDDNKIDFSLTSAPLSELESIKVASYHVSLIPVFLPRSLLFKFEKGQTIELMLNRLRDNDLDQLIEVIGRRVSHCRIDPTVEEVLRRRRPRAILRLENPDKFEASYHSSRILEELPQILKKTIHSWARMVGPIGTIILATPLWLAFNLNIYNILRDYQNIGANRQFYESLVSFLVPIKVATNNGMLATQDLSMTIATSPVVAFFCIVAAIYLTFYAIRSMVGANRLTVDKNEISLDRFFSLFSFTQQSAKWEDVELVSLEQPKGSADPNRARITFRGKEKVSATGKKVMGSTIMTIKLGCLAPRDRERLSLAIIKFAGDSCIASNLTEALEPSQDKSYTELWLKSLSDTPSRRNLEPLSPGHLLENSRYEIDKKLAVGGEGVAYLGRDLKDLATGTTKAVVLKETLIPPFVDKQVQKRALERFEREARLLKDLESEYVVGLRDYFIEDHRCYLVLDYVEGKNLRQYVTEHGPMDEARVLLLIQQMGAMLSFLHDRGVIHRDFTPDNMILQEDGQLKLIDFNVARESDDGKTGTIVGKHAYVPPEQFRGKPTKQSDLYALGATLHFLLVGKDPEPISQSSPASVNPRVSAAMNALVQSCTALDTTKRMQSVADFVSSSLAVSSNQQGDLAEKPATIPTEPEQPSVCVALPAEPLESSISLAVPLQPLESSIYITVPLEKEKVQKKRTKVKAAPRKSD
jgi:serine/threonine protein kinase